MEINTIISELMMENTYKVNRGSDIIIIDPGCGPEEAEKTLKTGFAGVKYVLLTHGHYDHTASLDYFDKSKVYAHIDEKPLIENPEYNMSAYTGNPTKYTGINYYTGEKYEMDGIEFFHVPGHTAGGVLIKIEDALFTGDTLFFDTVGRTDFFSGDPDKLRNSLKIFGGFSKDTVCYPGHGQPFCLRGAFDINYFLR